MGMVGLLVGRTAVLVGTTFGLVGSNGGFGGPRLVLVGPAGGFGGVFLVGGLPGWFGGVQWLVLVGKKFFYLPRHLRPEASADLSQKDLGILTIHNMNPAKYGRILLVLLRILLRSVDEDIRVLVQLPTHSNPNRIFSRLLVVFMLIALRPSAKCTVGSYFPCIFNYEDLHKPVCTLAYYCK